MNLQPAFFAEKLAQIERLERTKQLNQIFEWVKTGHISRAIFRGLIIHVMESYARDCAEDAAEEAVLRLRG